MGTFSYAGPGAPNSHTLTPLTNTDSSPPPPGSKQRGSGSPPPLQGGLVGSRTVGTQAGASLAASGRGGGASPYGASMLAGTRQDSGAATSAHNGGSATITPAHTPPQSNRQARPGPGEIKGYKTYFDPELITDPKRAKEKKMLKAKSRPFGQETDPSPPPDPRLAIAGYSTGTFNGVKAKLRPSPILLRPYPFDPKISCGGGPATQVVVTGFDPVTPESKLRTLFASYGEIAEINNKTDPNTGSFLGICLVRYKDPIPGRKNGIPAAQAARRAEKEGSSERINMNKIRVQRDRSGHRCKRFVEEAVKRNTAQRDKLAREERSLKPPPTPMSAIPSANIKNLGPPPDAPKGPSGKGIRPPEALRAPLLRPSSAAASLVEREPIINGIKRKPYIFIAKYYVPVLGATIPHLKKRLKLYAWREVRCDETGYYIIFEDSRRGEEEAVRCFHDCHMTALFTYVMNMECQQYGDPNYERSPSPERVAEEKRKQAERERLAREEEEDEEFEKQERARNLDPIKAAIEIFAAELKEKVLSDVKSKIAARALYDYLDPDRHAAKRRKLGISDPGEKESKPPTLMLMRGDDTPSVSGTPDSRNHGFSGSTGRHPLSAYDVNSIRPRGKRLQRGPVNAFADDRRKRMPQHSNQSRKPPVRHLHQQLRGYFDQEDDSDDEQRTPLTRDTDEQESRPLSRMSRSSTAFEVEDDLDGPPIRKRRKVEAEQRKHALVGASATARATAAAAAAAAESEDEAQDDLDDMSARLLRLMDDKEPEDMTLEELDQVIGTLPHYSKIRRRAETERAIRFRNKEDDELFGITESVDRHVDEDAVGDKARQKKDGREGAAAPEVTVDEAINEDMQPVEEIGKGVKTKKVPTSAARKKKEKEPKPKRKTKKQLLEEEKARIAAEVVTDVSAALPVPPQIEDIATPETPTVIVEEEDKKAAAKLLGEPLEEEEEEERAEVEWGVSTDHPRRTVEDDLSITLDIHGWQHLVKDDEDLRFLRKVLKDVPAASLGDTGLWAWKQKEIKLLNNNNRAVGVTTSAPHIDGYYMSNMTGAARTEGVKKILESEKSKYLPHRIRVQKAREEREARAKNNPQAATEAAKLAAAAKTASTANSRMNRANNRRLVNEMNTQKATMLSLGVGGTGVDGEAGVLAMRFNQLKKRKKLVKFDRSAIHNWGLYAQENIAVNDMIIEYVGEKVRQRVADLRELRYLKQGIGSSYLFRIDEDTVVDATKKGGIARFINHSCTPNCTAKIIKVDGTKRIVIYALRDIAKSEFAPSLIL
ncbi:complex proteins associated with Set1p component N-domain-containing protein [Lineolata rhizophorae]|uniref:Histone-lysine N-methyltransferase, H3 lysine-4 specific n=1 Tax=Lineolata rhizophorae TaxID=578093 RepID=A0A6A6NST5_9PEZI|nr:complex proteins associated with Set1p component N-domain-containing protein [Lineolata rhizophorae]